MNNKSKDASRGNILIVDDTPNNLRLLSSLLSAENYEVRKALNGRMALLSSQAEPPDLILLDVIMPEMDGYEVCQQLKGEQTTASIPVIFVSALDSDADKTKAFEVGGVDYITKPFKRREVLARIETQFNLLQLQQQIERQEQEINSLYIHAQSVLSRLFLFGTNPKI